MGIYVLLFHETEEHQFYFRRIKHYENIVRVLGFFWRLFQAIYISSFKH